WTGCGVLHLHVLYGHAPFLPLGVAAQANSAAFAAASIMPESAGTGQQETGPRVAGQLEDPAADGYLESSGDDGKSSASWSRSETPALRNVSVKWALTVRSVILSRLATSSLDAPLLIRSATVRWRRVSLARRESAIGRRRFCPRLPMSAISSA